jgi:hypothetical protein
LLKLIAAAAAAAAAWKSDCRSSRIYHQELKLNWQRGKRHVEQQQQQNTRKEKESEQQSMSDFSSKSASSWREPWGFNQE